jgi:hypothetical protein
MKRLSLMCIFLVFCLIQICVFPKHARAVSMGAEVDMFHPTLKLFNRTSFFRLWFTPYLYVADNWAVGADYMYDDGRSVGSSSTNVSTDPRAPTILTGLRLAHYFSGFSRDSLKLCFGYGVAHRDFDDSALISDYSDGAYYLLEGGYQWVIGNHFSLGTLVSYYDSSVGEEVSVNTGTSFSRIEKGSSETILKVTLGVQF